MWKVKKEIEHYKEDLRTKMRRHGFSEEQIEEKVCLLEQRCLSYLNN